VRLQSTFERSQSAASSNLNLLCRALAQLNIETGISITDADGIVLAIIAFNLIAAFLPAKGKLVLPEHEFGESRPKGSLQDPKISMLQPKKFFGITGFGFTKANELFVGRMAQLGFAAALIGEIITGKGPLGQFGMETGIPVYEAEPLLLFSVLFTLFAAINEGRGRFVEDEE
jgi:photosystem II 22kDa protein